MPGRTRTPLGLIGVWIALHSTPALACPGAGETYNVPCKSISTYVGQGVQHLLRELPGALISGDIARDSTYLKAVSFNYLGAPLEGSFPALDGSWAGQIRTGAEVTLARHHGLQRLTEVAAAASLRLPEVAFYNHRIGLGGGLGLSAVSSTPTYEVGPPDRREQPYRTQVFMALDAEYSHRSWKNVGVFARLHHRSSGYGWLGHRDGGSNYLALGVRYTLDTAK